MPIVNPIRPNFIGDLTNIKAKIKTDVTQTQYIFDEIIYVAGLFGHSPSVQYQHLIDILDSRDHVYDVIKRAGIKIDVKVTGALTECICQIALDATIPNRYSTLPNKWKWLGDFAIIASPFNLYVSVKSYKAKERLLVSGTGQFTAPVIGYGLFDKPGEWSESRTKQYKQRGFIAIYMPRALYDRLSASSKTVKNIYERPLLRIIDDFADDISAACPAGTYEIDYDSF